MLHTAQPLVLQADEADHIRRESIVRIVAFCLVLKAEAVAVALLSNDSTHRLVFRVLKPSLDPDEAAADSDVVENLPLREAEDGRDIRRNLRRIVRVIDMIGIDKEGSRHTADGELLAVAIENRTAQCLYAELITALVTHPLCKHVALNHLQIGIAERQHDEHHEHHNSNARNAPLHDRTNIFHRIALPHFSDHSHLIIS